MNNLAYADSLDFGKINLRQGKPSLDAAKERLFVNIMDLVTGTENVFSTGASATQSPNINAFDRPDRTKTDIGRNTLLGVRDFERQLDEIRKLSANWNGYGTSAPNSIAFHAVGDALAILQQMDFWPTQLGPSAEEGIGIVFAAGERRAIIQFFNDGDAMVVRYEGDSDPVVWEIGSSEQEIKESLHSIYDFIDGSQSS